MQARRRTVDEVVEKIKTLSKTTFKYEGHAETLAGQIQALEWSLGLERTLADEYRGI